MSFRQFWAVTVKEIRFIFRDKSTLFSVLITPTLVLFIMAYSMTVDISNVPITILDYDRSSISTEFIQKILAGEDLILYTQASSMQEVEDLLQSGKVKAAIILDPSFGEDVQSLKALPIQILIDGTEPQSGGFALDHIAKKAEKYIKDLLLTQYSEYQLTEEALTPIDLRVRTWFNPSLKPRVDMIPGLISLVLGFPALSVALTLAHEHEHGTMEQLMTTPIGRVELLLGKIVPYILIGLINSIFIPIMAILWFKIPFNGSFFVFFILSIFFLFSVMSMGIVIGVFFKTQASGLAISFLLIFFPGFFLTGIFFPIISMPDVVRLESMILPGTHYAIITRGVFLTGVGFAELWPFALMLFGLGTAFIGIAALFFRKKLG
jgi:ABC-2 type transport system permease protein